jgi:outer membrane protein TolC
LKTIHTQGKVSISLFLSVSLVLIFSLGFHAPQSAFGQQGSDHHYSLERAIQSALLANLGLKSAQEETMAAMARKNARRTEFFPTFNLTYQYVRNDDKQRAEDVGVIAPKNEFTFVAGFSQSLFAGFSIT